MRILLTGSTHWLLFFAGIMMKDPSENTSFFTFLMPFTAKLWCFILLSIAATAGTMLLVTCVSNSDHDCSCQICPWKKIITEKRKFKAQVSNSLWFLLAALLQQGTSFEPKYVLVKNKMQLGLNFHVKNQFCPVHIQRHRGLRVKHHVSCSSAFAVRVHCAFISLSCIERPLHLQVGFLSLGSTGVVFLQFGHHGVLSGKHCHDLDVATFVGRFH